jgi:hypothetical protein
MAKKDRTYKLEILMTGNPPAPEPVLKGNPPLVFNKAINNMKKVDHYRIRFELDNPNKTNLRFIQDMANVMWVHGDIAQCPSSPCAMPGVIWVDEIDSDGEWIDVINMDLVAEKFRFTLNLADKSIQNPSPADYVPLDPIGENQNRGSLGSDRMMLADLTVSIGVGLVAGLVAFAAAETFLPAW